MFKCALNRGTLLIAAFSAAPAFAGISTNICPPIPKPTQPYAQIAGANAQPARCYFCGKTTKYFADFTTKKLHSYQTAGPNDYVQCHNFDYPNQVLTDAREIVEIRGWIIRQQGYNAGEDEWLMDILLDVGWDGAASKVYPEVYDINSVGRLAEYMSPVNVPYFGGPRTSPARPPPVPFPSGTSDLGSDKIFGGVNAPVIHLEVDGWGPNRGACDATLASCTSYQDRAPPNWYRWYPNPADHSTSVDWPFELYTDKFRIGQYIRAVGTLWKDEAHDECGNLLHCTQCNVTCNQQSALDCWASGSTEHIGSQEMHGVDFIEDASALAPNAASRHVVAGYSMCIPGDAFGGTQAEIHATFTLGVKPYRNSVPVVTENYFGPVINWAQMKPPYNDPTSSSARLSVFGNNVLVDLGAASDSQHRGLFNAWYDAKWSCTPSCVNACAGADDGCGTGICPTSQCATGYTCPGGTYGECCAPRTMSCNNICTAVDIDPSNCGTCGHVCTQPANGSVTCDSGFCAVSCNAGYCRSGSQCVSKLTSPTNCGSCNFACSGTANGQPTCTNGQCGIACNSGYCLSAGQCVSPFGSDHDNCGACGRTCTSTQSCVNGTCVCSNVPASCPRNTYWDEAICKCSA